MSDNEMHPKGKSLDEFILNIHDGSMHLSPAEFQHWALNEIRQLIDFDFAIWGAGDGRSRELDTATIIDQVGSLFHTWEAVKHEDPFANLVIGNTGKTWVSEQLPDFKESRAYNEHWGLYQAREMISTMEVDARTGLHIFVTLARTKLNAHFNHHEVMIKKLISQHLFLAAQHNDVHYLRTQQAPAAFIDRRGRLHAALQELKILLADEFNQPTSSNQLPPEANAALWQTGRYRGRRLVLNAEHVGNRLLIRAGLCPEVSLSPREEQIAWSYASGNSYKDVAKLFSISPTTVRTHLSRIYQKLEISDKGALATWLNRGQS